VVASSNQADGSEVASILRPGGPGWRRSFRCRNGVAIRLGGTRIQDRGSRHGVIRAVGPVSVAARPFGLQQLFALLRCARCLRPGRGRGTRTHDPRFWRPMLYQLSYTPRPVLSPSKGRLRRIALTWGESKARTKGRGRSCAADQEVVGAERRIAAALNAGSRWASHTKGSPGDKRFNTGAVQLLSAIDLKVVV
jgi:hypothetical protein